MSEFSPQELDVKIHTFMKRKMEKFPELNNEQYYIERMDHETREGVSRQLFPTTLRFGAQY